MYKHDLLGADHISGVCSCHSPFFFIEQLVQKAHVRLENEIACISLNPTSNQPVSHPEPASAAMECDEGSKLDSLVAVGMWTDMTVSLAMFQSGFVKTADEDGEK